MKLDPTELDAVCDMVFDLCGIYLDSSKDYLIESRLAELVKKHQLDSYEQLARKVRSGLSQDVATDVINAITTNETLWLRDKTPFDALQHKLFPELIDAKAGTLFPRKLRVWSAASSTGQEAYSIAMTFADMAPDIADWDLQIVGTDVSPDAVLRAQQGRYSQLEMSRGLDQRRLSGYFTLKGREYEVCDVLRSKCRFQVGNLLKPFASLGKFDVIFCRNVAIYFTDEDRRKLFENLSQSLNPGGWLIVGSSEALSQIGPQWDLKRHCGASCYCLKDSPALVGA